MSDPDMDCGPTDTRTIPVVEITEANDYDCGLVGIPHLCVSHDRIGGQDIDHYTYHDGEYDDEVELSEPPMIGGVIEWSSTPENVESP